MISPVSEIISEISLGRFVILVDDENRENEGDLVIAAEYVKAEHVNYMAKYGRGLICLTLTPAQVEKLKLPMMKSEFHQQGPMQTAFTVSIEARHGITTGISAADRAVTIQAAANVNASWEDVISPGHIFPLKAHVDGLLGREGHTEASVDLAQFAGLNPAAVICEIMNDDGTMARLPDLIHFAKQHSLKIGTIKDLLEYRKSLKHEKKSKSENKVVEIKAKVETSCSI